MKYDNTTYDIIVVGAGPAGSVAAEALARASFRVALLEEHLRVGLPNHCSGLVSPRTLKLVGVTEEDVCLARFSQARVWGPGGKTLWLHSPSVQAIAIDRPQFDQQLARRAANAGATLMLDTQAHHFEQFENGVQVEAQMGQSICHLHASLIIGADGAYSRVRRWMGIENPKEAVPAITADIVFLKGGTDSIEIFVGNDVATGWFGWIIPLKNGQARLGVGATRSVHRCFETLLDLGRRRFGRFDVCEVKEAVIPLGPERHFVGNRVMLVGAAARQTKPTTGGGIYLGVRAAQLAAATATRAIQEDDFSRQMLTEYERAWHRCEGPELAYGHWLRQLFRRLSDRDFDLLIKLLGSPLAQRLISRLGDIDFPSRLFVPLMAALPKQAAPLRAMEARRLVRSSLQ